MATITAANSIFNLNIPGLFPISQTLRGYATDDAFAVDQVDMAEVMMGVDGHMSAGFTPFPSPMTITFQADSPSIFLFDTWAAAQKQQREIIPANAAILLPATNKAYTLTNGVLTKANQLPDVKKVLGPQKYVITWESINSTPV